MGYGLQASPRIRIGEDDAPQRFAIDGGVRQEDLRAEGGHDGPVGRGAGKNSFPREEVGIDNRGAESFQYPRNGTFPRRYPTGQSYD